MVTEDYVSFETAKLLKEKGFDGGCRARYRTYGTADSFSYEKYEIESGGCEMHNAILAPTLQMAMKWLREVHNICISVDVKIGGGKYYACVSSTENGLSHGVLEDKVWDTFEEACDAAIEYCLENLI